MKTWCFNYVVSLCVLSAISWQCLYAQRTNYYTLPAFTDVSKVPWRQSVYRFPEFQKGKITYTQGFVLDYEFDLNYNIYYEKMDFIHSSGDTLSITNTREIKSIQVGNKSFFHDYNTGYYEVLVALPLALAFRNQFVLEGVEYSNGQMASRSGADVRGIAINQDRIYKKGFSYFFIDQNNEVHKATRASLLNLFPDYSTEIKSYLLEHPIDFESQEDLIALTSYCNQFIDISKEKSNALNGAIAIKLPAGKTSPFKNEKDSLYRFPEFQEAKITWDDKTSTYHPQKMNYNLFTGAMDVVDEKGDTIKFKKWSQAKILNLDGNVFYQDNEKGFLEMLLQGEVALAAKSNFTLVTDKDALERAGLMEQTSASEVSNKASVAPYDRLYQLQRTYFFIYRNQTYEANKLSILRLMQKHKEEVVEYINENNISLTNEQHLKELTTFCNGLLSK
jgi:hypothetical protein